MIKCCNNCQWFMGSYYEEWIMQYGVCCGDLMPKFISKPMPPRAITPPAAISVAATPPIGKP